MCFVLSFIVMFFLFFSNFYLILIINYISILHIIIYLYYI